MYVMRVQKHETDCCHVIPLQSLIVTLFLLFFLLTARNGWPLSWGVLNHIQACEAWPTWYRCHSLISFYSSEVVNPLQ